VLNRNNTTVGKTATIARAIYFVNDGCIHVAAAQKVSVQRMCNTAFHSVLCRRQCLSENLTTKYLRTADVAAVTAKNILFDSLELEKRYEVLQYRMHGDRLAGAAAIDEQTGAIHKGSVIAGKKQGNFRDIDRLTEPPCSRLPDAKVA